MRAINNVSYGILFGTLVMDNINYQCKQLVCVSLRNLGLGRDYITTLLHPEL